jgi:hypothetical protein
MVLLGGEVSTVSVVNANGISGVVANAATTPAITLSLDNYSSMYLQLAI